MEVDVPETLRAMTGGQGPDACIDAVGLEAHGTTLDALVRPGEDVDVSWRRIARTRYGRRSPCCRKGGTVSIPGVYGGLLDKFPLGAAFAKGLTLKMGQTHMQQLHAGRCSIVSSEGEIDPSFIITHRVALDDAPNMYRSVSGQKG